MKVKTQHVPEDCDYLTNDKEYEAFDGWERIFSRDLVRIVNNNGMEIVINLYGCEHLDGQPWEVIPEEGSE